MDNTNSTPSLVVVSPEEEDEHDSLTRQALNMKEEEADEEVNYNANGADPLGFPPELSSSSSTLPHNIAKIYDWISSMTATSAVVVSNHNNHDSSSSSSTLSAAAVSTTPSPSMVIAGSVANLCSATLGAGVLALPYAFYQAGWMIGGILLCGSAIATIFSIDLLVTACDVYSLYTYETLAQQLLGPTIQLAVEVSIVIFCVGVAVAYVIAVGDILEKSHLLLLHNSRNMTMMVVWLCAMVPLSMLRKMQSLQFASAFGIASIGTLVFAATIHLMEDHHQQQQPPTDIHSNFGVIVDLKDAPSLSDTLYSCLWPANGIVSILTACPIILFAFSCQCNVCAIYQEIPNIGGGENNAESSESHQLRQPLLNSDRTTNTTEMTTQNGTTTATATGNYDDDDDEEEERRSGWSKEMLMHKVTVVAVLICAGLYTMISVVALADFGEHTTPNILSSYRPIGVMQVAMSAMAVAVVMAFPLNIFPARVTCTGWMRGTAFDQCLFHRKPNATESSSGLGSSSAEVVVAVEQESGHRPIQQHGPSTGEALSATLLLREIPQRNKHGGNGVIGDEGNDPDFNWKRHILLTILLTVTTLAFAIMFPDISVVFGLLGGTASSFLGFCVPGLLGLRLCQDLHGDDHDDDNDTSGDGGENDISGHARISTENMEAHPYLLKSKFKLKVISWSLLIGGVAVGVLTTGVTFYSNLH